MPHIEVNLGDLAKVVRKIDSSMEILDAKINEMAQSIDGLGGSWSGPDYEEFKKSFESGTDSAKERAKQLKRDVLTYRAFFNESIQRYKKAQDIAWDYVRKIPE